MDVDNDDIVVSGVVLVVVLVRHVHVDNFNYQVDNAMGVGKDVENVVMVNNAHEDRSINVEDVEEVENELDEVSVNVGVHVREV